MGAGRLKPAGWAFVVLAALPAWARAGPTEDLKDLRERLERLQKQLTESEASRSTAADALRQSERAISNTTRRLFELENEHGTVEGQLSALAAERTRLEASTARQRDELNALLRRIYMQGQPDALVLILSGQDPNELPRRLHYLGYIYNARAQRIEQLRKDITQLNAIREQAQRQAKHLASLEAEQSRQKQALLSEKAERQAALMKVSDEIARQRREIETLKRDEERLARLVQKLAEELAARAKAKAKARKHASRAHDKEQAATPVPSEAQATEFAKLKGRLTMPLRGELANRFGSPRFETGLRWNGIFINAPAGTPVHSVAEGRVVFADWLRGFGNLLILDHGEGFMSLYGNNESLLRKVGDSVPAGETIAAAGTSGGNPESGLYFEMRFRGKPVDPLAWIKVKQESGAD
ncbi:MAG TPA: peptidoglycan DD-metalloendopeptidase family protein [Burkholderiales bacterium]|nr:peptidoglycan DD-metalloendopeptidase family protein [Burkholderiales bacterium]